MTDVMLFPDRIRVLAKENPEKTSIIATDRTLSFGELDQLSDRVAFSLLSRNVCGTIGFLLDRKSYVFPLEIGAVRSGITYIPMTDEYPEDRIIYIMENAGSRILVTTRSILNNKSGLRSINFQIYFVEDLINGTDPGRELKPICPEQITHIIYTSGSTGRPKGVAHTAISDALSCGAVDTSSPFYEYSGRKRTAMTMTQISFVAFNFDLSVLYHGGTVCFPDEEDMQNFGRLTDKILKYNVRCFMATPSFVKNMLAIQESAEAFSNLEVLLLSGEKPDDELLKRIFMAKPQLLVIDVYGSTEANSICFSKLYTNDSMERNLGQIQCYLEYDILDESGKSIRDGSSGELVLSGSNITPGYVGLPDSNTDIFFQKDGRRWFRTGDIVRRTENGGVDIGGRKDEMVKFHGQRVELPEIEHVIQEIPEIRQCKVLMRRNNGGDFLVAFFTADEKMDGQQIVAVLSKKLPVYMIPKAFIQLDEMPLNANKKIDRMKLMSMELNLSEGHYVAPDNAAEKQICEAFCRVLGLPKVSADADFFYELGGDSLSVAAAAAYLEKMQVSAGMIYKYRTAQQIARALMTGIVNTPSEEELKESENLTPSIIPYQRYYIDYQLFTPKETGSSLPECIEIQNPDFSAEEISNALDKVFHHFAIFESVFAFDEDGNLSLHRRPDLVRPVQILHLPKSKAYDILKQDVREPFRIIGQLLYRCKLCVCENNMYILYINFQHAIIDGMGIMQLMQALIDTLEGKELWPDAYYYYLSKVTAKNNSPEYKAILNEQKEKYCRSDYARIPKPDHEMRGRKFSCNYFPIPLSFSEFEKLAKKNRTSVGLIFSAAGMLAMKEYNQCNKVQINWIYSGRDEAWVNKLVGLTMTAIPVAVDFDTISNNQQLLSEIKYQNNKNIPFATLSTALEDNSPAMNDTLNMIYEGELQYPDNFFPDSSEVYLFNERTGISALIECGLLVSRENDSMTLFINSSSRYDESSIKKFADLITNAIQELAEG